jgi:hypothetical protein
VSHTTRSVVNGSRTAADAGTTAGHHLATDIHEFAEYRYGCGKVKQPLPQTLDALNRKKLSMLAVPQPFLYWGFAAGAAFGAAAFVVAGAGVAAAPIKVALRIESSFGQPLSI